MELPLIANSSYFFGNGFPLATNNYHSTKSYPVIISVTGCSTYNLVFISIKKYSWVSTSNINSTVPALWYDTALAASMAEVPIFLLNSSGILDGASSTTF